MPKAKDFKVAVFISKHIKPDLSELSQYAQLSNPTTLENKMVIDIKLLNKQRSTIKNSDAILIMSDSHFALGNFVDQHLEEFMDKPKPILLVLPEDNSNYEEIKNLAEKFNKV
ncbi:hypothetical protein [Legionella clemsonensis]|uniref:Uncharacterized protein n=1 Tax=Legionella clemsonensis TaxID=1867846 RepID=A0A222P3E8_9GAMM|nr:hypothetical protein [Legionella clemsonensis]ASQ46357.1 hypothetical protein clem_09030 [Legionella clemsonensis]